MQELSASRPALRALDLLVDQLVHARALAAEQRLQEGGERLRARTHRQQREVGVERVRECRRALEAGADVDLAKLAITSMQGLKRSVRTRGRVLGHRMGVHGRELLDYVTARRLIYLPSYRWVLAQRLREELSVLRREAEVRPVVLLDYETNDDPNEVSKPLSHASLIARYLRGDWAAEPSPRVDCSLSRARRG